MIILNLFQTHILIKFLSLYGGLGDWGLGIGDWGLGPIPNPQSPIPNPQSPIPIYIVIFKKILLSYNYFIFLFYYILINV